MSMMAAFSPTFLTFILTWAWGMSILLVRLNSLTPSYSPRRDWSEPGRVSSFLLSRPISRHRSLWHRALFVWVNTNEVRETRDVENLHVVVAQAIGQKTALRGARSRQEAYDQGDASTVHVVYPLEVQEDNLRVLGLGLGVGSVKGLFSKAVDLTVQVDHGRTGQVAHARLQVFSWHGCLLSGGGPARLCGGPGSQRRVSRRPCSL